MLELSDSFGVIAPSPIDPLPPPVDDSVDPARSTRSALPVGFVAPLRLWLCYVKFSEIGGDITGSAVVHETDSPLSFSCGFLIKID